MKTVLFFTDYHTGAHIAEIEGIIERARAHNWRVVEIEYERASRPLGDYIRSLKADGCILVGSSLTKPIAPEAFQNTPTIYLAPDPKTFQHRRHCVVSDTGAVARAAFQELSALSCVSLGFVGWMNRTMWSEGRRLAFKKLAEDAKLPFFSFTETWNLEDKARFHKKLEAWIRKLPKPCGIFAANDETAVEVADVCHFLGLEMPKDVAVVGVDNLEFVCENAMTSLTSIEIDFYEVGRKCVDFLARLLDNPDLPPETVMFGPERVVQRQSTCSIRTSDDRILRALERIRRESRFGLKASEVIAEMGISRRLAEQKFRAATGKTILEAINDTRLEHAFALLRRPNYPISTIATQCGWNADVFLKRLFKKKTGLTMREWRKHRDVPAAAQ